MTEARKYELETCPVHGMRKFRNGLCLVVTEQGRISHCFESESVTAYDAREVDPLVEAAIRMCRAAAGVVNATSPVEVSAATREFDDASDALAEALEPFNQEGGG